MTKRPAKPRKTINMRATSGSFTKDDGRAVAARQKVRGGVYTDMKHEMTQILVSVLNEIDKETSKEKKYLLVDRLVSLGLGLEIKIGKRTYRGPPDRGAIKEILDRLIGRPVQAVVPQGPTGGGRVTLIFDADGDETD